MPLHIIPASAAGTSTRPGANRTAAQQQREREARPGPPRREPAPAAEPPHHDVVDRPQREAGDEGRERLVPAAARRGHEDVEAEQHEREEREQQQREKHLGSGRQAADGRQ
jgi:hypothetical protein